MPTNPMEYIWPGIIAAQAIHAAAKLRIPDLLASGTKTIAELASESSTHPRALERLLNALTSIQMFARTPDGRFSNTPLTEVLRSDHPQSQRDAALFLPSPFLWRPLGELAESVRTGQPVFERAFGQRFFDYLGSHPDQAAIFNASMSHGVAYTSPALLAAYDFSRFERLVDVGGGQGALIRDILSATPKLRGVLFDLPQVVSGAGEILAGEVRARCEIVGGDFFQSVPEGADAYILKGVLHDWPDDDAVRILQNVRAAIRPAGTLLLLENVLDVTPKAGLMDLLMLVIAGRERAEADFRSLVGAAGFRLTRIVPLEPNALVECHPV